MGRENDFSREIPEQFERIINKYNSLQEAPFDYGCGVDLYPSEIHVIEAIGKHPDAHMAEIARILGVTRGAIQQTGDRLVKKGLVEKFMDDNDRKKVYLELTAKGRAAFDGHDEYHAEESSRMEKLLGGLRPREAALLKRLLDEVESFMDVYREQKLRPKRQSR
jgi:DNA-binding MarR family transcriptional regulator